LTDSNDDCSDDEDWKNIYTKKKHPKKAKKTEEQMGRERQKVQLFKLWQHRRAYFKNDLDLLNQNDQVEPNMLAELKAELEALTDTNDHQNSINKSLGGLW